MECYSVHDGMPLESVIPDLLPDLLPLDSKGSLQLLLKLGTALHKLTAESQRLTQSRKSTSKDTKERESAA